MGNINLTSFGQALSKKGCISAYFSDGPQMNWVPWYFLTRLSSRGFFFPSLKKRSMAEALRLIHPIDKVQESDATSKIDT
jgi:hypothetical protein